MSHGIFYGKRLMKGLDRKVIYHCFIDGVNQLKDSVWTVSQFNSSVIGIVAIMDRILSARGPNRFGFCLLDRDILIRKMVA